MRDEACPRHHRPDFAKFSQPIAGLCAARGESSRHLAPLRDIPAGQTLLGPPVRTDSPFLSRLHTVAMAAFLTSTWVSSLPAAEPNVVTHSRASPSGAGKPMYATPSGSDKFACISYPAAALVDTQEGSVEMCVRNDFDSTVPLANPFYAPMTYVQVRDESGRRDILYALARSVSEGRDLGVVVGEVESFVSATRPEALGWRGKGEWHYLAITWKTDLNRCVLKLYQDGRLIEQGAGAQSEPLLVTEKMQMHIGNSNFGYSFATVDELRVSAVERSAEEIKTASFRWDRLSTGFKWDRFTLLLDHFDRVEPDTSGKASWTFAEGGVRGHIEGAFRAVPGRSGRALQLHVVEEELPGSGQ